MAAAPTPATGRQRGDARKYCAGAAPLRADVQAAVEAAYGKRSATQLAAEHRLTKGTVTGIWHRAKLAGRIRAMTEREVANRKRPTPTRPAKVQPPTPEAAPKPKTAGKPATKVAAPAPAPAPAAPPVDLAPAPRPSLVLLGLTGAAAALDAADKCGPTCRWPNGHPRADDFSFCGAPVTTRTVGERGRERPNFYCDGCRAKARGVRQPAPFSPPMLGHNVNAGPRAVRGAGPTRFGRAS